ncbi:MAG: hypothetical protein JJU28_16735 [Cyclobacteriaceae bacterium]|nr:hypothetical protein [Cyclobacteriaceae bacterium]
MIKNRNKLRLYWHGLFTLASLLILADFLLPGRLVVDEIVEVKKERQQYYNAARNYHYSYKAFTSIHSFSITEDFAKKLKITQKMELAISPIFEEINSYRLPNSERSEIYSLRILSGLIIPLALIIVTVLAFKYEKKMSVLIFVIQVLVIADLIFLIK